METDIGNISLGDISLEDINLEDISMEKVQNKASRVYEYLQSQVPSVIAFGMRVVLAIVVFLVASRMIKWALKILKKSLEKANVDKGVVQFVCSASRLLLYLLLIFNVSISFGVEESSVAALLASAGVTIGLGLQGGLANVAGGVMLLLFKPFQVGDYIVQNQANGYEGTVSKIDMYYTTLMSVDNKNVVIPNGTLANSTIINVTARESRKLEIKIGISYDSDVKEAKRILEKLLHEDPDIRSDEEMMVVLDELADSSVIILLRAWVATDKYWPAKWRLNERIKEEFDAHGIKIPYNQMDVHLYQGEK